MLFVIEMGRTEYLHNLGVLSPRWLLVCAIHVRDHDVEPIANAGASVSQSSTRGGALIPADAC